MQFFRKKVPFFITRFIGQRFIDVVDPAPDIIIIIDLLQSRWVRRRLVDLLVHELTHFIVGVLCNGRDFLGADLVRHRQQPVEVIIAVCLLGYMRRRVKTTGVTQVIIVWFAIEGEYLGHAILASGRIVGCRLRLPVLIVIIKDSPVIRTGAKHPSLRSHHLPVAKIILCGHAVFIRKGIPGVPGWQIRIRVIMLGRIHRQRVSGRRREGRVQGGFEPAFLKSINQLVKIPKSQTPRINHHYFKRENVEL